MLQTLTTRYNFMTVTSFTNTNARFSEESVAFLREVKSRNSKEWYEENKWLYKQYLLDPFQYIFELLSPVLLDIDPCIDVNSGIGGAISRIYRDTRFSKDKSYFRDRMWLTFKRDKKKWIDSPVYFFEIRPDSFYYGLGYYAATRATMDHVRDNMIRHKNSFLNATDGLLCEFTLSGEMYKRPLHPAEMEDISTWFNRKSITVMKEFHDMSILFNSELAANIINSFVKLGPLYNFLVRAGNEGHIDGNL